jgi:hypothetical protein
LARTPHYWRSIPHPGGFSWAQRLRLLVSTLALAVVLASFMHVAHSHEADEPGAAKLCSFCASFERGTAPPPAAAIAPPLAHPAAPEFQGTPPAPRPSSRISFQPRAPPHFQA